jgi:hypothetical protein
LPIEAASRAIDKETGRQFGFDEQIREYVPKWHRDRWYVSTDDMCSAPTLVQTISEWDGSVLNTVTNLVLTPRNAAANGRVFTGFHYPMVPGGDGWYGYGYGPFWPRHQVIQVTATFGWPEIPNTIQQATVMQAARWWNRQDTAEGTPTRHRVDDVEYGFAPGQGLDPDVLAMVAPYLRWWGAA